MCFIVAYDIFTQRNPRASKTASATLPMEAMGVYFRWARRSAEPSCLRGGCEGRGP